MGSCLVPSASIDVDVALEQIARRRTARGARSCTPRPLRIGSVVAIGRSPARWTMPGRMSGRSRRTRTGRGRAPRPAACSIGSDGTTRAFSIFEIMLSVQPTLARQLAHADAGEQAARASAGADLQVVALRTARCGRACPRRALAVAACAAFAGPTPSPQRFLRYALRHAPPSWRATVRVPPSQRRTGPALTREERFDDAGQRQHAAVVEMAAHDLQADRPPVGGEADRHRRRGQAGQVGERREGDPRRRRDGRPSMRSGPSRSTAKAGAAVVGVSRKS